MSRVFGRVSRGWLSFPPYVDAKCRLVDLARRFASCFRLFRDHQVDLMSVFNFGLASGRFRQIKGGERRLLFRVSGTMILERNRYRRVTMDSYSNVSIPARMSFLFLHCTRSPNGTTYRQKLLAGAGYFRIAFFFGVGSCLVFALLAFSFSFHALFFNSLKVRDFSFFSSAYVLSIEFNENVSFTKGQLVGSVRVPSVPTFDFA